MISWMLLLVTAAIVAGVLGFGALAAAMKVVIVVTILLAAISWAHRGPRRSSSSIVRGISVVRPR